MGLDNQSETNNETNQPVEALASNTEATEAAPTESATDQQEFYVDDSSDDQENSHKSEMTQAQAYAAFQKKKKQSAARKAELEAKNAENQRLQAEIDQLKAMVIKPPKLYDDGIDGDEAVYAEKMREFYATNPTTPNKETNQPSSPQSSGMNEEDEFYLYQHEQALSKAIPDYEGEKQKLINSFSDHGITNTDAAMGYLSNIARKKGVDIAKVVVAMAKVPSILNDVIKAGDNDFKVADILQNAADKVKTREKKQIDSKPEPEINNQGVIDHSAATLDKLYKEWQANTTIANHKRYMNAKNKSQ
jgi:hypothetical protein